jgi:hypothetical protein
MLLFTDTRRQPHREAKTNRTLRAAWMNRHHGNQRMCSPTMHRHQTSGKYDFVSPFSRNKNEWHA